MPGSPELIDHLLFVIVLYRTDAKDCVALNSILDTVPTRNILIYDNSPSHSVSRPTDIVYVEDAANGGVSAAYNKAKEVAASKNLPWLFLLDQDSAISADSLVAYSRAVEVNPKISVFTSVARDDHGIVSPYKMKNGRGRRQPSVTPGRYSFNDFYIINSGMLISVSCLESIGGYDERFPMDFSDVIVCERLRRAGIGFVLVDAVLSHQLSAHAQGLTAGDSLRRFRQYCDAAKNYGAANSRSMLIPVGLRALRLSIQHRNISFFLEALRRLS